MKSKFSIFLALLLICSINAEILPLNLNFDVIRTNVDYILPKPTIGYPTYPPLPPLPPNPTFPTSDIPCGGRNYCGQAVPFKSETELKSFTQKYCQQRIFDILPLLKTTAQPVPQATQTTNDFSGTNNQQGNVDQADILKTDGEYIYSVSGNILSIIKAYPYQSVKVQSTISFTATPQSMFIEGNYLTVFGTDYQESDYSYYGGGVDATFAKRPYFYYRPPYTWVYVYDLCNKTNPKLIKDYKFQGYYFDGRKTQNGYVYLLSSTSCNGRTNIAPWYNFGSGKKNMTASQVFYYPGSEYDGANFINIFAFNLKNPFACDQNIISILTLYTYVIYMSESNIYLTSTTYIADGQITNIRKIFVSKSKIIPCADGKVQGTINNQFSMDQYNGTLRVATTETGITGQPSNNVFCLNKTLKVIGTLRNIAVTERIFSARYVDKRLYLVTFRQIDPFFVIDLSNHANPTILGELKISGFSRYLHPYDANTIIGFGRQANDTNGQQLGLKVSLFDVADVNNPQSVADFVLDQKYAYSTAQWEHKAFLFSKQKNLLVIPGSFYDWEHPENNTNSYNGAYVFNVRRTSQSATIELKGIVNHVISSTDQFWDRSVERSLYIEDLLYTKSRCLLRVNTLSHLNPVVNLPLNCDYQPIVQPRPVSDPIFLPSQPIILTTSTIPIV